jgi:hypothetical protein
VKVGRRGFLTFLGVGSAAALAGCEGPPELQDGVDVAAYGAKGDGITDDTEAIAAAVTAAGAVAREKDRPVPVRLMAGTHVVRLRPQAVDPRIHAAIELPSRVHLTGVGRGATVIKLRDGEPVGAGHIVHNAGLRGGDSEIVVSDLTVDGNGPRQTQLNAGLSFLRASDVAVTRVTVRNVHGTAPFPPGETFHFNLDQCARVTYTDCLASGDAGTQGSGFGDNSSTNVNYSGCTASGMSAGMGFTTWHGACISYTGCRAQQCGANGFNAEVGQDITYAACIAGADASDQTGGYVYGASAGLGNGGSGFVVNGTRGAVISGGISRRNRSGISVISAEGVTGSCQVLGGHYSDNSSVGIYFDDPGCSRQSRVSAETQVESNGDSNWAVNNGIGPFDRPRLPGPAQPSGEAVTNPFPFRVAVNLSSPSGATVLLNGVHRLGAAAVVLLGPEDTLQVDYGTDPGFIWLCA